MPQFQFSKFQDESNPYDKTSIVMDVNAEILDDVLVEVQNFLTAAGYVFGDRSLSVVHNDYSTSGCDGCCCGDCDDEEEEEEDYDDEDECGCSDCELEREEAVKAQAQMGRHYNILRQDGSLWEIRFKE